MTQQEFIKEFVVLLSYYKADLSTEIIALYYENLKDFSIEEFIKAKSKILKTRKFSNMPSIAEFIENLEGDADEKALNAWDEVLKAMDKFGAYESVAFKDTAITKAILNIGGWIELNNADDLTWLKKDFIRAYKAYCKNSYPQTIYLQGIAELNNRLIKSPCQMNINLIGYNKTKCNLGVFIQPKNEILTITNNTLKRI